MDGIDVHRWAVGRFGYGILGDFSTVQCFVVRSCNAVHSCSLAVIVLYAHCVGIWNYSLVGTIPDMEMIK